MVYLHDDSDEVLSQRIKELFERQPGIEKVIMADEFAAYGLPHPSDSDQAGQLALFARPGYALNIATEHDEVVLASGEYDFAMAHHGFLNHHPQMNSVFIVWGNGIQPGNNLGVIESTALYDWIQTMQ